MEVHQLAVTLLLLGEAGEQLAGRFRGAIQPLTEAKVFFSRSTVTT